MVSQEPPMPPNNTVSTHTAAAEREIGELQIASALCRCLLQQEPVEERVLHRRSTARIISTLRRRQMSRVQHGDDVASARPNDCTHNVSHELHPLPTSSLVLRAVCASRRYEVETLQLAKRCATVGLRNVSQQSNLADNVNASNVEHDDVALPHPLPLVDAS